MWNRGWMHRWMNNINAFLRTKDEQKRLISYSVSSLRIMHSISNRSEKYQKNFFLMWPCPLFPCYFLLLKLHPYRYNKIYPGQNSITCPFKEPYLNSLQKVDLRCVLPNVQGMLLLALMSSVKALMCNKAAHWLNGASHESTLYLFSEICAYSQVTWCAVGFIKQWSETFLHQPGMWNFNRVGMNEFH